VDLGGNVNQEMAYNFVEVQAFLAE